ncbi:MAG: AAA family ATPase [Acidobacteriota bacterium]
MRQGSSDNSDKNLQVLLVGNDRTLEEEFRTALQEVPDRHGVIHFAESYRDAVELARRRQPTFVLVEIDREIDEVTGLLKDLQELVPGVAIAGTFRPDRLEQWHSESATIIELLRAQMRDFIRRPLSTTELRVVLDRLFSRQADASGGARGQVASFMSNKGGVGKSALVVNVACRLAVRHPDEVLLIDTSLQVGSCAFMLDLKPTTSIVDATRERERLDRTLLRHLTLRHSSGLRLLAAPTDALEAAEIDDEAIARIVNMARHSFKYVLVDTFPMLDTVLMTILDLTDVAFIVVQATAPAVAGAARLLPMIDGLGIAESRQRLVLNYNYKRFVGDLRPGDIADRLQRTIDYVVPYEKGVLVSMNTGVPQVLRANRWSRFGRAIDQIVGEISDLASRLPRESAAAPAGDGRLKHVVTAAPEARGSRQGSGRLV